MNKKIAPKLSDIWKNWDFGEKDPGLGRLTVTNVDDVFSVVMKLGIPEVIVDSFEMHIITKFMLANSTINYGFIPKPLKPKCDDGLSAAAWKILREGKVDKFWGVKLVCE